MSLLKDIISIYKEQSEKKKEEREKKSNDYLGRINTLNNGISKAFHDYNLIYTTDIEVTKQTLYNEVSRLYYGHNHMSHRDQKNTMISISNIMADFSNDRAKGLPDLAFNINNLVQDYFSGRSKRYDVRCTIKQFMNTEENNDKFEVFNILSTDENSRFYHDENSAFKNIFDSVNYRPNVSYICNDIISEISQGLYFNKRIDKDCTYKYWETHKKSNNILKHLWEKGLSSIKEISGMESEHVNLDWFHCWSGYNNKDPHINDCYQSTLVLPITIKTSLITSELKRSLKIKPKTNLLILGFLCIDHPEKGFFNRNYDISALINIIEELSTVLYSVMKVQFDQQYISAEQIQKSVESNEYNEYIETIDDESIGTSAILVETMESEPVKDMQLQEYRKGIKHEEEKQ